MRTARSRCSAENLMLPLTPSSHVWDSPGNPGRFSFWLGAFWEGSSVVSSSDMSSAADLAFNEVAIRIAENMAHASKTSTGETDLMTRTELVRATAKTTWEQRQVISNKESGQTTRVPELGRTGRLLGYHICIPCTEEVIESPQNLRLPIIDP